MANKGNIGVTTENIFPVIKKFLYSDHEIFLREMVSNAVDATQKLKTLANNGELKDELGDLTIHINVDEKNGTLTISDKGIGMTEEEIDKYINQIAFSGANDFLDKYKDTANGIIGHFGLGFYSAFMVSKKVEIITKSYREDAQAVEWSCDGSPEFEIKDAKKSERGTDIVLYIDDDCKEFLDKNRILQLLGKYCKFLPVPIACGKKTEWKDGKSVETEEDNIINSKEPLWTKTPSTLKDEDYKDFYRYLYPYSDEPLFWIHLNVDYPFNLTGILYFPRVSSNLDLQKNKIQLYCNNVFVTDQVEGIVPEFLTLLHGVIDSPDIPLNVSRSYLQSDANVKKISTYITKKVSDRLNSIFKENRKEYEEKWDNLKLFIAYGMLSQEDFFDKAKEYALFKDVDGKYFTYDEYKALITAEQTDKDDNLIYLYATNKDEQYSYIEAATNKGYSVLMMDGDLDVALIGLLEQKLEKSRFSRVDSDILSHLINKVKEAKDNDGSTSSPQAHENENKKEDEPIVKAFKEALPKIDKVEFTVQLEAMGETAQPILMTQSEYMRRMKDVSRFQSGMNFYGQMPDMYSIVLNKDHKLIKQLSALTDFKDNKEVSQLIDLALLQNGLLKGAALNEFLKRSFDILK